jgi:thiamine biosynthesis lipoprotein
MTRRKIIQIILGLALVTVFAVRGFYLKNPILVGGTMGTSYSVTVKGYVSRAATDRLYQKIEVELAEVNQEMSTWIKDSEISRFNRSTNTEPFQTSEAFAQVVGAALELSASTGGAFDPTLNPLLNLWGFGSGSGNERRKVPSDAEIAKVKNQTGWHQLHVDEKTSTLWKSIPGLQLDLGAIAKGYGVDAVGHLLDREGYKNWFVEIGGEVAVRGTNPDGVPWRIGIQFPTTNPVVDRLQGILNLAQGAVATSGDYRNYIEQDGLLYSHILDPRSGRAALSDTASVTVSAPDCMHADGIATALFVMGADEGLAWVEKQPEVEALFLVRGADGKISEKFSSGFEVATGYAPVQ